MPLARFTNNSGMPMTTQRRGVMLIAGMLVVLAAIMPLIGIAAYARHDAAKYELSHVQEYSEWTLQRAGSSLDVARSVLDRLDKEGWRDCSADHMARMRVLAVDGRSVEEIGFFIDGRLACTSWGRVTSIIPSTPPATVLPDGTAVHLGVASQVPGAAPMIALSRPSLSRPASSGSFHRVLMPSERLLDVLTDTEMALGVADLQGNLIAVRGAIDPDTARTMAARGGSGRMGTHFYAVGQNDDFRALAVTDQSLVAARISQDIWRMLPVSLGISAILIGLIIWISRRNLSLEGELAVGIKDREFFVCYQPIIELSTGLCVGAEALLRWTRSNGSSVPPDLFIPFAEQHQLIEPLTDVMIDCVVTDLAELLRRERNVHITINISAQDMESGRFLPVLHRALSETSIDPSQVWLEATERGFMDAAAASKTLRSARENGHMIAIDDFGTGYSSLAMLEQLPLDTLKIDRSFIDAIGRGAATSRVIPHIIDMAHGLRLNIVAEGVETVEQETYLRKSGVKFAQGWLYSKALPVEEFLQFFQDQSAAHHRPIPA